MWIRYTVLLIMAVLMIGFMYKQINQNHLDFCFITYLLIFMAVSIFFKPYSNKK